MNWAAAATAFRAHHPSALAIIEATASIELCGVCGQPTRTHARCFWCTVLLGPGHVEDVPAGWKPGDRRALECDYCWLVRKRRSPTRVAS